MKRIFLLSIFLPSISWSLTQGPNNPATGGNDTGVGSVAWASTGNTFSSNDSKATITLSPGQTSNYLTATNFSFNIPIETMVTGVFVEIEKEGAIFGAQEGMVDNSIRLIKGGTVSGDNKATGSEWPLIDTYVTYGGSSDLWGLTLLPSDVNASTFGIAISGNSPDGDSASVDHIRITVYYDYPPKVRRSGKQTRTLGSTGSK